MFRAPNSRWFVIRRSLIVAIAIAFTSSVFAQNAEPPATGNDERTVDSATPVKTIDAPPNGESPKGIVDLTPNGAVKVDRANGIVLVKTQVCLQAGVLEMLLCRRGTKEHESILSVDAPAQTIHAGLLLIGAKPGKPVQYVPEYRAPTGSELQIHVSWKTKDGKQKRQPAHDWIRHATRRYHVAKLSALPDDVTLAEDSRLKYDVKTHELYWYGEMSKKEFEAASKLSKDKKFLSLVRQFYQEGTVRPMKAKWVFAGSFFEVDEETGKRYYQAESGDVICVANFSTAMVDIATRSSSQGTGALMFEAWEERVPELGTPVTLELSLKKPVAADKRQPGDDENK